MSVIYDIAVQQSNICQREYVGAQKTSSEIDRSISNENVYLRPHFLLDFQEVYGSDE